MDTKSKKTRRLIEKSAIKQAWNVLSEARATQEYQEEKKKKIKSFKQQKAEEIKMKQFLEQQKKDKELVEKFEEKSERLETYGKLYTYFLAKKNGQETSEIVIDRRLKEVVLFEFFRMAQDQIGRFWGIQFRDMVKRKEDITENLWLFVSELYTISNAIVSKNIEQIREYIMGSHTLVDHLEEHIKKMLSEEQLQSLRANTQVFESKYQTGGVQNKKIGAYQTQKYRDTQNKNGFAQEYKSAEEFVQLNTTKVHEIKQKMNSTLTPQSKFPVMENINELIKVGYFKKILAMLQYFIEHDMANAMDEKEKIRKLLFFTSQLQSIAYKTIKGLIDDRGVEYLSYDYNIDLVGLLDEKIDVQSLGPQLEKILVELKRKNEKTSARFARFGFMNVTDEAFLQWERGLRRPEEAPQPFYFFVLGKYYDSHLATGTKTNT